MGKIPEGTVQRWGLSSSHLCGAYFASSNELISLHLHIHNCKFITQGQKKDSDLLKSATIPRQAEMRFGED